jgi:hypothetical protein
VRILATFIYPLTDHHRHTAEKQALLEALTAALRQPSFQGVQILLLHPESGPALARAAERKDDDVLQRMEEGIATLAQILDTLDSDPVGRRVRVRLFTRTPSFSLFQTDNFASISFYYRDRPLSEVARYEFFTDTPIGVFFERTFDDLWRDEQTVSLEDHLKTRSSARIYGGRS